MLQQFVHVLILRLILKISYLIHEEWNTQDNKPKMLNEWNWGILSLLLSIFIQADQAI